MKTNTLPSNFLIYTSPDGTTKLEVRLQDENIWLNQEQIAMLYWKSKSTINEHIKNIYLEGEQLESRTLQKFGISEFQQKLTNFYNLDMIIAVGYRVKSPIGTRFRQRATERLHEYIQKGFTMNDDFLKNMWGGIYRKELLDRIRDIRSSEKVFYRQILDIYATSVDYDPKTQETLKFFKTVQNKMHFAVHHHTAPELIYKRADWDKDFAGLTTRSSMMPKLSDAVIAKNYLSSEELDKLNRLTTMFLDQAEYMAQQHIPMTMKDWSKELDNLLSRMRSEVLGNAGSISNEKAIKKAKGEFNKYQKRMSDHLTSVEKQYLENLAQTQKVLEKKIKAKK